jgi:hypothetical protein
MFGDVPEHIRKRHEKDVPSLGKLDDIVLPATPAYVTVQPELIVTRDAVLDSSAKLDSLTQKALEFYDELLSAPTSFDDLKLLNAQSDAARTIMTTQLRVDDSRLKKRSDDTLAKLLERMEAEDLKLMKVVNA